GHTVAFVGRADAPGGGAMLYLRHLDQLVARPVPGTEGASTPRFSPDDKSLAFIVNRRKLVKVSLDGGATVPLADIPDLGGVDWSTRDDIVLGAGTIEGLQGLFHVKASGGALVQLTHVDTARKELSHEYPRVLADGKTVLFTIWYGTVDQAELAAASLDDGKVVRLGIPGTQALGVVDGRLVYIRADGMVLAVPFDVGRLRPTGVATPMPDSVRQLGGGGTGAVEAFLTDAGGLVFGHGAVQRHLVWVDHAGKAYPAFADGREFTDLRISPNGRQVAVTILTGAKSDIWILDLAGGTLSPLTTTGRTRNPAWSPDSRRILFASTHGGRAALWWQPVDGSGPAVKAGDPLHNQWNLDLSPDGHTAVFNAIYNGSFNLESFSLDGAHEERELAASPTANEVWGRFSPDGRSVAYQSDESHRAEVYVRPFPEDGSRVLISAAGGQRPIWDPDGKHIYFRVGSKVMSATLARDPALRVVSREMLFDGRYGVNFDVSNDGKRFLMIEAETTGPSLIVVPNWLTELRRLTAARKP
ncbi:MAG: TolB family protein, partial [Gemmatimonadales bacterium]